MAALKESDEMVCTARGLGIPHPCAGRKSLVIFVVLIQALLYSGSPWPWENSNEAHQNSAATSLLCTLFPT